MNSGELRIPYPVPYPVPVCVTGNLWLVKFNGFILQLMAKTNHKFPDHANRNYYERDTEFEVLLNSLYFKNCPNSLLISPLAIIIGKSHWSIQFTKSTRSCDIQWGNSMVVLGGMTS